MIYEHGEPWWNDVDRGKLLILTAESPGIKQEEWAKGMKLALGSIFFS
jgi:hypothetical protein